MITPPQITGTTCLTLGLTTSEYLTKPLLHYQTQDSTTAVNLNQSLTLLSTEFTLLNYQQQRAAQRKQRQLMVVAQTPQGINEQQIPQEIIQVSNIPYHHLQATKVYASSKANKLSKRTRAVIMQEEDDPGCITQRVQSKGSRRAPHSKMLKPNP